MAACTNRDTPEGSPPPPYHPPTSPAKPADEPPQLPAQGVAGDFKSCSQCHEVKSRKLFVRSDKDRTTDGFKPEEMSVCNKCGFFQHMRRMTGESEGSRVPKCGKTLIQLMDEYMELYGAEEIAEQ